MEQRRNNYGLELWSPGCGARLARSNNETTGRRRMRRRLPGWHRRLGDERILVDVARYERYRSLVYGLTDADHAPNDPDADYQLAVAFGPANDAFRMLRKEVSFDRTPAGGAPAGVMNVVLEFQNTTRQEYRNFTFFVRELAGPYALLSATVQTKQGRRINLDVDVPATRGTGATISVPNMALCYSNVTSSMCTLQEEGNTNASGEPDDRFKITFRLGALAKEPLRGFTVDIFATPTPSLPSILFLVREAAPPRAPAGAARLPTA